MPDGATAGGAADDDADETPMTPLIAILLIVLARSDLAERLVAWMEGE